ncbi:hypothetical protein [Sphingomonas lenta]|uniref:Uncharacterized protein n=1 Tax=Sphingomonas lenta TaxID=1141887 RepID=A0A2A2SD00_9SPHN|nr:hypothetical protein [Sphingomonas lenta]PAX07085.1 hypothetical protein CKY28_13640 [Sphingomonas lenta]
MSDKQPNQAMPSSANKGASDGVSDAETNRHGGGESAGGGYANPQTGKEPTGAQGFMGHGGQTKVAYHGTGQGGTDDDADVGNVNAPTKQD